MSWWERASSAQNIVGIPEVILLSVKLSSINESDSELLTQCKPWELHPNGIALRSQDGVCLFKLSLNHSLKKIIMNHSPTLLLRNSVMSRVRPLIGIHQQISSTLIKNNRTVPTKEQGYHGVFLSMSRGRHPIHRQQWWVDVKIGWWAYSH